MIALGDTNTDDFKAFKPSLDEATFDFLMHTPSIRVGLVDTSVSTQVKQDLEVGDATTLVMY